MTTPLTLAEAVPLGTVHLQRLLERAGVRSLAIKGPAFVELGVRQRRTSNDIDLLVHPSDRNRAARALVAAGWSNLSLWYPRALDDVTYSITFHHFRFPTTVDLHHHFSGLLSAEAFDVLWRRKTTVDVAHCALMTPARPDAFVIETLNALKATRPDQWDAVCQRVLEHADELSVEELVTSAETLGAAETAAPMIRALGRQTSVNEPSSAFTRWMSEAGGERPQILLRHLVRRAPWAIPRVMWSRLTPQGIRAIEYARGDHGGRAPYTYRLVQRIRTVARGLGRRSGV